MRPARARGGGQGRARRCDCSLWLRTNGVSTDRAAAKVRSSDRLGKKVHPGTFGRIKVGERGYPKSPSVQNIKFEVTPLVLIPFVPFRRPWWWPPVWLWPWWWPWWPPPARSSGPGGDSPWVFRDVVFQDVGFENESC